MTLHFISFVWFSGAADISLKSSLLLMTLFVGCNVAASMLWILARATNDLSTSVEIVALGRRGSVEEGCKAQLFVSDTMPESISAGL